MDHINKSHKEVMFLYDMLSDKQVDLKNVVREADAKTKEVENSTREKLFVPVDKGQNEEIKFVKKAPSKKPIDNLKEAIENENSDFVSNINSAKKNNNDLIIRLHEEGKSNVEIAKELNLGVGEVALVIDLYER